MPRVNKQNPNRITAGVGPNSFVEIEMSAAEAVEVFGVNAAHVDGFYRAFEVSIEDAKKLKQDPGAKLVQNEAGETRAQIFTKDDVMLEVTSLYADAIQQRLNAVMERRARRVRGTYPAPRDAAGDRPATLFGIRNAFKVAGSERDLGTAEMKQAITLQGSRTEDGPGLVEGVVDLDDEAGWPANLAPWKSDAVGA